LFPGHPAKAGSVPVLEIPEWEHLDHIASVAVIDVKAHFSFLIENLMDMHHGHLHAKHQAWANASLLRLEHDDARVDAFYEAHCFHRIDSILSAAQLFIPPLRRLHLQPLDVSYVYPHWVSRLGDDFRLYGLLCPVGPTRTKAYLIHFTSLRVFKRLQKLPVSFRRWVKDRMFNLARPLLDNLIRQDVLMIEEEQAYFLNRQNDARGIELNPTLMAVQRLVTLQASHTSDNEPVPLEG
jgi:phenylpropionate dioxygenase-like ring-hydroxylating dioxygenase large terminal subunit